MLPLNNSRTLISVPFVNCCDCEYEQQTTRYSNLMEGGGLKVVMKRNVLRSFPTLHGNNWNNSQKKKKRKKRMCVF